MSKKIAEALVKAKEVVAKLEAELAQERISLSSVSRGETFKVGEHVFIKLKEESGSAYCVLKGLLPSERKFDANSNNWAKSELRKYLNSEFLKELENEVSAKNICEFEIDLTSLDGLKDYDKCIDKVSLMTYDLYKQNRDILEPLGEWFWLCTPFSTPTADYSHAVCIVRSDGTVGIRNCSYVYGVRPFCIFQSDILVSCED